MGVTLPPLSLSTGPAIAGGPTESGAALTGDFIVTGGDRWQERLAVVLPVVILGGVLWFLTGRN